MGCDIHLHIEVLLDGAWHHYNHRSVPRCYELFGYMAGVRGGGEVVAPRGLPPDATVLTRYEYDKYKDNWHHASWLSASEVAEVVGKMKMNWFDTGDWFGWLFGHSFVGSDWRDEVSDYRFVFWFDN